MIQDPTFWKYVKDAEQEFSGWDFSWVTDSGRMKVQPLSWNFEQMIVPHIRQSQSMLDMGTGGGEFLSSLQPFPPSIYATEAYAPNVPIAKERLEPLGVQVVQIDTDDYLPFADQQFNLITNQHEAYSPSEVRRLLQKDGWLMTQQVGGLNDQQINQHLHKPLNQEFIDWNLATAVAQLEKNDFEIVYQKEEFPTERFYDIGALLYYLKAIPWQIPNFQIEEHMDDLYAIHLLIQKQGYFEVKQHRFVIHAQAK
ncbi:class I SAM-dependent methyltransferase [Paenibacillus sp. PK4536]|uniref:class I SAM-dependent methyltransferase n=1 Tax=Paenibacillus sp. PK4536 TaxID=3024576 RepID=UPI00235A215D|nr:class I SAM-dependent methyltransferase [Paenibacillus sp. PK4536]WIM37971.1 class I SAM-dependent methyltransferase [Paenibacillus sp. PK4536]